LCAANLPDGGRISLSNWSNDGRTVGQKSAFFMAQRYTDSHPLLNDNKGLIFTGGLGVGKTHLAIGLLKAVIVKYACTGIYYRQGQLLDLIRSSIEDDHLREADILRPLKTRDVLVLDDVGTSRPTEWVLERMLEILAERYDRNLATIITTNYPVSKTDNEDGEKGKRKSDLVLGDRIGNRATSRLSQMCVVVDMDGEDVRFGSHKARF
jgi:DNA replication protein DnaC